MNVRDSIQQVGGLDPAGYAAEYETTLVRVHDEKPDTFGALKAILDRFQSPRAGDAFFPYRAGASLADALLGAGWELRFFSTDRTYIARHPSTLAKLHHLDGDLYDRTRVVPSQRPPSALDAAHAPADGSDR